MVRSSETSLHIRTTLRYIHADGKIHKYATRTSVSTNNLFIYQSQNVTASEV
jgi:hypothetical protein